MTNNVKLSLAAFLIAGAAILFWTLNKATTALLISNARAVHINEKIYAIYLNMENTGGPDIITAVAAKDAERAFVMGITPNSAIAIPKGSKPSFASDGAHIMVVHKSSGLKNGEFIPMTLSLAKAGNVRVKAFIQDPPSEDAMKMSMSDDDGKMDHSAMDHSIYGNMGVMEIASGLDAPKIEMSVARNEKNDWLIEITTDNFEFFEPVTEPLVHKDGQGHGHLYLNGLKLQRMFSQEAELGALPPGKHVISVTLNTNDHKAYSIDGSPVSASAEIVVE